MYVCREGGRGERGRAGERAAGGAGADSVRQIAVLPSMPPTMPPATVPPWMTTRPAAPATSPVTPPQTAAFGLSKRIFDARTLKAFQKSAAHKDIVAFLHDLSTAVAGTKLSDQLPHCSPLVTALKEELSIMARWVDDIPPVKQAMRYGNVAYKQWHARMVAYTPQLMRKIAEALVEPTTAGDASKCANDDAAGGAPLRDAAVVAAAVETSDPDDGELLPATFIASALPTRAEFEASLELPDVKRREIELTQRRENAAAARRVLAGHVAVAASTTSSDATSREAARALSDKALGELSGYLSESFGNPTRIDYGTGHELSFVVFLRCLDRLGLTSPADRKALVLIVLTAYLDLMRRVQDTYKLEPAGSHGVWGLDDYQFVPFLLGAAQLVGHQEINPASIHDELILSEYGAEYLYLGAIQFIRQMKRGHFGEHSPMLNDISGLGSWRTVCSGLARMYEGEVLGKLPVVQHLPFGTLLEWEA